jgi:hypothetical protein
MANQSDTEDEQMKLAEEVAKGTAFHGHVEREGGEWVLSGWVDASQGSGVMIEHESGARLEPGGVRARRFSDALDLAIEAGMCDGPAKERLEQLLVSRKMERF